jgi:hypothetical protein
VTVRQKRSWKRHGAILALLSIALQFFLTFDHVHLEDILGQGPFDPTAVVQFAAPHSPAIDQTADAADSCPLCASIMLAGSLLIPDVPSLAPAGFIVLPPSPLPSLPSVTASRYLRAPSRAPPIA